MTNGILYFIDLIDIQAPNEYTPLFSYGVLPTDAVGNI